MRYWKYVFIVVAYLLVAQLAQSEEEAHKKLSYEERMKIIEAQFLSASQEGKTVKGVIVEGNSLFNGTTSPQKNYEQPYTKEELRPAKFSAERNSKVFILTKDGTLYYPTPRKGESVSQSMNSPRIPRVLTEAQKKGPKLKKWATLVPLVGMEVEVCGEVYPGYGGIKGVYIESIQFAGDPQFD